VLRLVEHEGIHGEHAEAHVTFENLDLAVLAGSTGRKEEGQVVVRGGVGAGTIRVVQVVAEGILVVIDDILADPGFEINGIASV